MILIHNPNTPFLPMLLLTSLYHNNRKPKTTSYTHLILTYVYILTMTCHMRADVEIFIIVVVLGLKFSSSKMFQIAYFQIWDIQHIQKFIFPNSSRNSLHLNLSNFININIPTLAFWNNSDLYASSSIIIPTKQ